MTTEPMNTYEKCSQCGFCKAVCPMYKALLSETESPRGFAILIKKNKLDSVHYDCSICDACKEVCPARVDLEMKKRRAELVKKGIETEPNKKMMKNLREFGNPFGKYEKGKKVVGELYCC